MERVDIIRIVRILDGMKRLGNITLKLKAYSLHKVKTHNVFAKMT